MGGKKNQVQRTKNNAKPSSSGRSANLLGMAKPVNTFLAFSVQKEMNDDIYQEDIDPNIQVVLKKMSKKDSTTKLKALQEFTTLCSNEETEATKIIAILSLWSRQYVQLAVDIEHKVRESAHVCHEAVVRRCKRNLAPYLKQLVGPWFVSQCDTHAPAATAASRAFSNAFPPNKIQEAVLFCQTEIIKYIVDNLTIQTAETLSNPTTTTPEEREMKYQRILISCLEGYALYLDRVPSDQLLEAPNKELVASKAFWKHAKNGSPVVRSAWYSALIALCQFAKHFLEDELANVAKTTVGCLDETDALVAPLVWEATLHALVALPAAWTTISVPKVFIPKVYSICRKAGHGSASVTFPSLLPLISQIPTETLQNPAGFYDGLCSNLREGLKERSVQQSIAEYRAVVDALVECIQYCVARNQESDPELCRNLVKTHLLPLLTSVENATPKIVVLLKSWSQRDAGPLAKELFYSCCDHISRTFSAAVDRFSSQGEPDLENEAPEMNCGTILNKQMSVMTNLLKGEKLVLQQRNKKVKFAAADEAEGTPVSPVSDNLPPNELYDSAMCGIAATLCGSYLKGACDTLNPKFLEAILKLVTSANSPDIFINLASIHGYSESALILSNFFLEWMHTPENPLFCKETVSLSLQLLFHLPSNAQRHWFDEILSPAEGEILDPKLLSWLLEDLTTPEAKERFHVEWMKNSALRTKLVELAQRVVTSQEENAENVWTLLDRVAELSIEEGHKDDGSVLKGILKVVEDSLQSDEIESKSWLVAASTLLGLVYDSRSLGVLDLPPDHTVVQTVFQVYLESIEDVEQAELFEVCTKALNSIYHFSGPDSNLFRNICTALNEDLQNYVLSQEWSQAGNIVTVAARLSTLLKSLDEEKSVLALLRKLCGPPAVPGTTGGPLSPALSEYWSIANALVCNAESVVSGGTNRSEADVMADRYSACLAEGIPTLEIVSSQMEVSKAALWILLSVAAMADVTADVDSVSPTLCSLVTDVCAALAVTSNLSQYFPSMELTYCVDSIKSQSDVCWKRFYSNLSVNDRNMIQDHLLKRAVEDLTTGGRYWVRALEFWLNSLSTCLSQEEASRLLAVPAEYYSTVLISRLGLIKEGHLPVPVIPSSGTLETLNLSQFAELVMYLLSSEANQESVALQGLSALSCVHRLDSKRLLFDSNIFEKKTSQVRDVIRTILFVRTVLVRYPTVLTEPQWDLILISMASWIPSLQRVLDHVLSTDGHLPHVERLTPTMVCSFVASVCDLYVALQSVLSAMNDGILKLPENVKKETISDAWRDVFAAECDRRLVRLWINLSDSVNQAEEMSPVASLVLEHISACVSSVSLGYLDENMTAEVEDIMEQLLSSLSSPVPALRLASYHLLIKLVPIIIKKDAEVLFSSEDEGRKKSSEGVQLEKLVMSMFGTHIESLQNELEDTFSGTKLGETLTLQPFTEQYNLACGYLLLWLVVLEMYGAANADVRCEYASVLKSQNLVQSLLHNVVRLLPQIVLRKPDPKNKVTHDYFTKKPSFECSEKWTFDRLSRMGCQVFLGVLIRLPAMARTWWGEVDSKSSATIDRVISDHCSSIVSAVEMKDVLRHQEKAVENMAVKVHMGTREVVATYTVDDLVMELVVKLPNNYPLAPMSVEIGKRSAAGSNQWRTWLMQITIFLTHQNGSLWDGLALWRNLVVRRYEGVEECYICFCVLHGATYQLPKLSCRTCRKKFHSQCLYKWFQTSNKSTCPICRNLF